MKNFLMGVVILSYSFTLVSAADRDALHLTLDEIKKLSDPVHFDKLERLLDQPHLLSQQTKDALLSRAFTQNNHNAIMLLLNTGARPTSSMWNALDDQLKPVLSVEKFNAVKAALRSSLEQQGYRVR